MEQAIKDLHSEIMKTHHDFKEYVDKEFSEIRKGGAASPETVAALAKMNEDMSAKEKEIQKRLDDMQVRMERPAADPAVAEKELITKAMITYLRKGWRGLEGDPKLIEKALSVGSDPDGGWFVKPAEGPMAKKLFDTTPMRQVATVETISTDAIEGIADNDEMAAGWTSETGARSESATATFDKYSIPTHEIYAEPRITQKLLDDSAFNVEAWLNDKVADKLSRVQNAAFLTGDGVGKPKGLTKYTTAATADATRAWGTIEHVTSGASADFTSTTPHDKIQDIIYTLKAGYRQGAMWMLPKAVLLKIRKFKEATTNAFIWQPGLQAGQPATLAGYGIIESEDMPALAANSLSLAFGNFKAAYLIVDRAGIRVLRDPFTAKPYIKFYTTARVGGGVVNSEAVKLMKFAS